MNDIFDNEPEWRRAERDYGALASIEDVYDVLGKGDRLTGMTILADICGHVAHADDKHPWPADIPIRAKFSIAKEEWLELLTEYEYVLAYGLDDRDAPLCDEEKLYDHLEHMYYEAADLMAVLIKIMRRAD